MKKITIAYLLGLSLACVSLGVACKDGNNTPPPPQGETHTVTLEAGEGYSVIGNGVTFSQSKNAWVAEVTENTAFSFTLDVGAFYAGTPTVTVGNVALGEANGAYTFTVVDDTNVSIDGIFKDVSAMVGSGAFDDAFVVSRPIDLVYIAEQVNSGNQAYSRAYYVLGNDIDCKGEEIPVIGDMNNENAYFSGCFSCVSDGESSIERYSISNFTINAKETGFAGLFGFVQADMSIQSSGLFYGIRIDNFTINATSTALSSGERSIYCGGLIGYGVGVKSYLCDVTNGEINVSCDVNELSFVGGLAGILQGSYISAYNYIFLAEVAYATVDVDINVLQGSTLAAGGIVGYTITNSLVAPAFIHNSYATGNVSGAIRSGGVVGVLGQYTSLATSYASGNVVAEANNTAESDGFMPEFCIAYAGGLVGYAENDTVVNDSFSVSPLTASAVDGANAQFTSPATAGMDPAGKTAVNSLLHQVLNCPTSVNLNSISTTLEALGWQNVNWVINNGQLPTLNYEASTDSVTTTITVHYVSQDGDVTKKEKVKNVETDSCTYVDSYAPLVDALNSGSLAQYLTADSNALSYGYFFDEACTRPVPYSYVTTRNVDLYMGFAKPDDIVGEYKIATKNGSVSLTITADREVILDNGASTLTTPYYYDGKTLMIEGTRLAAYFDGEVDEEQSINGDTIFDLNRYMLYYFQAELTVKEVDTGSTPFTVEALSLFDGVYFTKDSPLVAFETNSFIIAGEYFTENGVYLTLASNYTCVYEDDMNYVTATYSVDDTYVYIYGVEDTAIQIAIADLRAYDVFKGEWKHSASVNDFISFDGKGNWSAFTRIYTLENPNEPILTEKVQEISGTYSVSPDGQQLVLYMNANNYATVKFNADGMLTVTIDADNTVRVYTKSNANLGLWESDNGTTLQLNGFNANGFGTAELRYVFAVNGFTYKQDYSLTYQASETKNYYCLYLEDAVFGYFYYYEYYHVLVATLISPIGDGSYTQMVFNLNHEIGGDWIGQNLDIQLNGLGYFNEDGNWVSTLTINGTTVSYELEKSTLSGELIYNNTSYTISYDPTNRTLSLKSSAEDLLLQRKDTLAGLQFVDKNDTSITFTFDGKSKLDKKGVLTVNGTDTYQYAPNTTDENAFDILKNDSVIGSVIFDETTASYTLTLSGNTYHLYLENDFMGTWAISGAFDCFTIYPSNLNGEIPVSFNGNEVLMEYVDASTLSFDCVIDYMPATYYLFIVNDEEGNFDTFAISQYASSIYGNYQFCAKVNNWFGKWTSTEDTNLSITFDGVNNDYANGIANATYKLGFLAPASTAYYYKVYKDGEVFLWSQDTVGGNTLYYKLVPCETTQEGAFIHEDGTKAFMRVEVDSLYKTEAKETATGYTFTFNGMNTNNDNLGEIVATKDGEEDIVYSYDIVSFNEDKTATLTLVNKETNETYTATLDYSNPQNITITLEKVEA